MVQPWRQKGFLSSVCSELRRQQENQTETKNANLPAIRFFSYSAHILVKSVTGKSVEWLNYGSTGSAPSNVLTVYILNEKTPIRWIGSFLSKIIYHATTTILQKENYEVATLSKPR